MATTTADGGTAYNAGQPGRRPAGGWTIETVAAELLRCEDERIERPPFTDEWTDLDLDTGYAIQDLNLQKRLDRVWCVVPRSARDLAPVE